VPGQQSGGDPRDRNSTGEKGARKREPPSRGKQEKGTKGWSGITHVEESEFKKRAQIGLLSRKNPTEGRGPELSEPKGKVLK